MDEYDESASSHEEALTGDDPEIEHDYVTEESSGPAQLRDALKRTQAELAVAMKRERLRAYADLGLDPETGMGKAISMTYDGDGADLADFAETEFGYVWDGPVNPLAVEINNAYSRLDAASVGAGSAPVMGPADVLAEAEGRRDNATTMAIKGEQVARMLRGR